MEWRSVPQNLCLLSEVLSCPCPPPQLAPLPEDEYLAKQQLGGKTPRIMGLGGPLAHLDGGPTLIRPLILFVPDHVAPSFSLFLLLLNKSYFLLLKQVGVIFLSPLS